MELAKWQFPENHQEIIGRFVEVCQADDRIVAAFIGGSYAIGNTDEFSDLDLFFVTTDSDYEDFVSEREHFIHQLGDPLFYDGFGLQHGYCIIFSNSAECDIWFGCESNFLGIYNGTFQPLLDKKGILNSVIFPARVAQQENQLELLGQQLDWFWHELSHFIKAIGRGQLWFAYGQIETMRQICVILARLQNNFLDAYVSAEPYFKIEQFLPVEKISALRDTFCSLEPAALLQAADDICCFYRAIAPDLAEKYGLKYQADLDRMLINQLKSLMEQVDVIAKKVEDD